MEDEVLKMRPDKELADKLRQNFTAEACVRCMFEAVTDMAAAVGVNVTWAVQGTSDVDVNKSNVSDALSRFATASGAILAGAKINPIRALKAQDPIKKLRELERKNKRNVKK